MAPVLGFLEVLVQLFLRLAAALANCAHLPGSNRRVCMQMRAWIVLAAAFAFLHSHIVPPRKVRGKAESGLQA